MDDMISIIIPVALILMIFQMVSWFKTQKRVRVNLREVESTKAALEECSASIYYKAKKLKKALDDDPEYTGSSLEQVKSCCEAYVKELQRAVSLHEAYQGAAKSAGHNLEKQRLITNMMGGTGDMSSLFYYANASRMNKAVNTGTDMNVDILLLERAREYMTRFANA